MQFIHFLSSIKISIVAIIVISFFTVLPHTAHALTVITNCAELQAMGNNLSEDYELGNDINCDVAPYNTGDGFEPVGDNTNSFEGTFDGNGFTINGLFIDSNNLYVGLFGYAQGATIEHLSLQDAEVDGDFNVGALVGATSGATTNISNVFVTGIVSSGGGDSYVGGIVGEGQALNLNNSYSTADVIGTRAGGLVSWSFATINNSFATGSSFGSTYSGGAVAGNFGEVRNTYSTDITLVDFDGGGTITNGSSGGASLIGFYETDPLHAVYLGTPAWDFDSIWLYEDANSLPVHITESPPASPTPTPTSTPNPNANNSSSTQHSAASTPSCTDPTPNHAPDLFQIDVNDTKAILYFTPVANAQKYFIAYGNGNSTTGYGVDFDTGHSSGVIAYTINHLQPNTSYSFIVRGGNGCATGEWSNYIQITTAASSDNAKTYYKHFATKVLSYFPIAL